MTTERAAAGYLSVDEASAYLGISTGTFYGHVRKHVRAVKIGSRVLFKKTDLDAYAESQTETLPEPVEPPQPRRAETVYPQGQWRLDANGRLRKQEPTSPSDESPAARRTRKLLNELRGKKR